MYNYREDGVGGLLRMNVHALTSTLNSENAQISFPRHPEPRKKRKKKKYTWVYFWEEHKHA